MERTETRERADESAEGHSRERDRRGGLRTRIGRRARRLFAPRTFLAALVLSLVGVFLGNGVPIVGLVGGLVGVLLAGFLLGLVGRRAYLEVGVAGAAATGVATLLDFLVVTLFAGPLLVAAGVGGGFVAGVLGHYFGRDLRDGLTRDL